MSAIVDVLTKITAKEAGRREFKICSYSKDFDDLWLINKQVDEARNKTIVIVWDEIPQRGRNNIVATNRYLTPIDWAVAFSLTVHNVALKDNPKNPSYPDLKILILDLNSQSVSNADSVKFVNISDKRDVMTMPWIRLLRPFEAETFIKNIINKATRDVEVEVPSMCRQAAGKTLDLSVINSLWAASLTRPSTPGDHHAIANLIGPLLLMGNDPTDDGHLKALRSLMQALGLTPQNSEKEDGKKSKERALFPWIRWGEPEWKERLKELTKDGRSLKLIMVDDQFHQGWGKLLCWAVNIGYKEKQGAGPLISIGADNQISVKATGSAEVLLSKLKTAEDQRFSFRIDDFDKNENASEILFLDLRLFSGKPLDEEIKFFNTLIPIARRFIDIKDLPWQNFDKNEIERVEEWCKPDNQNREREDDEYIEALTFLPRILALTDLSLPIVIFSSTGRRDIVEKFKPYGNIITAFDKPKLTVDIPVDIAEQTKKKFKDAFKKALSILTGRSVSKKVQILGEKAKSAPPMMHVDRPIRPFSHIEIYIDESGRVDQKIFSVGGLVLTYPQYSDVEWLSGELKNAGYYWYSTDPDDCRFLSKEPGIVRDGKGGNINWTYNDSSNKLLSLCGSRGINVAAVRLKENLYTRPKTIPTHFPFRDIPGDGRYIRLLKAILELILCELIPAWIEGEKKQITISIFCGTRTLPVNLGDDALSWGSVKEDANDYFGYGVRQYTNPPVFYSLGTNSFVRIITDILRNRPDIPDVCIVHHVRGSYLQYGTPGTLLSDEVMAKVSKYISDQSVLGALGTELKNWDKLNRQQNKEDWTRLRIQSYYADHVVKRNSELYCSEMFKIGFDAQLDNDLNKLLEARRNIVNGDVSLAVLGANFCMTIEDKIHGNMLRKVASGLNTMRGKDFLDICDSL